MKPIILIPGIGGSILVKKGHEYKHILNKRVLDNRWINIYPYNPLSVSQWKQDMGLKIVRNKNAEIVRVLPTDPSVQPFDVGGTLGVKDVVSEFAFLNKQSQHRLESAFQYRYFHTLCQYMYRHGYQDHKNLFGFPYDFRLVLDPVYRHNMFENMKLMIESAAMRNGGQKVVLVGHSLGAVMTKWFFTTHVTQEWVDMYIHQFICISAPFGGAMFAMRAVVSGDYYVPLFHKVYKDEIQMNTGIIMCLPNRLSYEMDTPLLDVRKDERVVRLENYENLAKEGLVPFQIWRDMYEPHLDTIEKRVSVPTHVVGCFDKSAPSMYYTETLDSYPYQSDHVHGDGVVDVRSLLVYERLFDHKRLRDLVVPHTGHTQLISDHRVVHLIHHYASAPC